MMQAIHATRPGGHVGFVGVGHGVAIDGMDLFWSLAHVHGGPAPVRRFLPELIDLIWNRRINRARSSTSSSRSTRRRPATARWTSARR
jgi:threonine dehydrogenase-like Zn-dependent dehydrogenase